MITDDCSQQCKCVKQCAIVLYDNDYRKYSNATVCGAKSRENNFGALHMPGKISHGLKKILPEKRCFAKK